MNTLTNEDVLYLNDLNSPDRGIPITETLKAQYLRQLDRAALMKLEQIAKRVIRANYAMCYHCSDEIYSLVKKLYGLLADEKALEKVPSEKHIVHKKPVTVATEEVNEIPPVDLGETSEGEPIIEEIHIEPKKEEKKK